jgi:hypothetical protein
MSPPLCKPSSVYPWKLFWNSSIGRLIARPAQTVIAFAPSCEVVSWAMIPDFSQWWDQEWKLAISLLLGAEYWPGPAWLAKFI